MNGCLEVVLSFAMVVAATVAWLYAERRKAVERTLLTRLDQVEEELAALRRAPTGPAAGGSPAAEGTETHAVAADAVAVPRAAEAPGAPSYAARAADATVDAGEEEAPAATFARGAGEPPRVEPAIVAAAAEQQPPAALEAPAAAAAVPPPPPPGDVPAPSEPPPPALAQPDAAAAPPPAPPARRPSLEERLGARLPVWLGSIALTLAGAFLVKYSLDQGWIGPRVRVLLALAFAAALIAAGERLRRTSLSIAQGTTAAGIAVLYATLLAAVHLYGLIGPWAGFLLLAATTAGAVALALRHGQMVALLGLLGGLLTPHLVMLEDPRPAHLFGYLLLLEAGLLAISRRRGWTGLALASLAGGFGWTVLALAGVLGAGTSRGAAVFLLGSAALAALTGTGGGGARWRGPQAVISGLGVGGALVLLLLLVARRGYAGEEWAFLGLLVAGLLVLARIEERFFPLAAVAAAGVGLLLLGWIGVLTPAEWTRFLWTLGGIAALVAGGAWAALWRSAAPGRWGLLSALAAGIAPLFAFAAADRLAQPISEGTVCLAVAVLAALAAVPPLRARARREAYAGAADPLAVAAAALVALAAWYGLDRGALTVAWALEVPLVIELSRRGRLPALWTPAVPLALLATLRLVFLPHLHFPAGGWPVLNRLLADYGLPALAFAVAGWRARGHGGGAARLGRPLAGATVLALFLLVTLEVRHAFHPGAPWAPLAGLAESGWWLAGWLGLAWALAAAGRRLPWATVGAAAVAVVAIAGGLLLHGFTLNPLVVHQPTFGGPLGDLLLWAYGVPVLLLLALDRELSRRGEAQAAPLVRAAAMAAGFVLVTTEVRRLWQGEYLDGGSVSLAEWGGLLAAWLVLALGLEAAGRRWPRRGWAAGGAVVAVVALLGLGVGPLLARNPLFWPIEVGRWPVLNLLLWVYGVPALLFAALSWAWRRRAAAEGGAGPAAAGARLAWWTAAAVGVVCLSLEVRQLFTGNVLDRRTVGFAEWGALLVAWLAAAGLARAAARRWGGADLPRLADGLVALAVVCLGGGPLSNANPMWNHRAVGALPVVNLLLWTYGAPALLLALHGAAARRAGRTAFARVCGGMALVLVFVLVTLEVRQAFRGSFLDGGGAGHGEQYAYSAAWVLLGTALLVAAITRWRSRALRLASLAVMALAVGKVFLYDTAHLTDLYRVLSFLGLGLSLLLLAWLYQRFVFRDGGGAPPAAPPAAAADG